MLVSGQRFVATDSANQADTVSSATEAHTAHSEDGLSRERRSPRVLVSEQFSCASSGKGDQSFPLDKRLPSAVRLEASVR